VKAWLSTDTACRDRQTLSVFDPVSFCDRDAAE
jgi:hypothetical protein